MKIWQDAEKKNLSFGAHYEESKPSLSWRSNSVKKLVPWILSTLNSSTLVIRVALSTPWGRESHLHSRKLFPAFRGTREVWLVLPTPASPQVALIQSNQYTIVRYFKAAGPGPRQFRHLNIFTTIMRGLQDWMRGSRVPPLDSPATKRRNNFSFLLKNVTVLGIHYYISLRCTI